MFYRVTRFQTLNYLIQQIWLTFTAALLMKARLRSFCQEGKLKSTESIVKKWKAASNLSHIQASSMNFDSRISHAYMGLLKKAVSEGVWNGICPNWFNVMDEEPGNKISIAFL